MRYVLMAAALLAGTAVRAEHPMDHPSGEMKAESRVDKDAIALTLKRVHDDKHCQISEKLCFACAAFTVA
ncbi:MAG: hypothetical protein AAB368_10200, partial [bacterium]